MRWILVSDASRARLFRTSSPKNDNWQLHESFEHGESRQHSRELMSDTNGRKPAGHPVRVSHGGVVPSNAYGRVGVAPHTDPKEVEAQKFARLLAERLRHGIAAHEYDSVVIVAPPHFLGLVKSELDDEVGKHVAAFLNKDLTTLKPSELETALEEQLAPLFGAP